ncbi:hypothetical protein DNTS_018079 [Danionella cerebrum]|uniref:Uncharacterized protein n=1 Tax=Danionella cerebrum TaxID=2873325 RepID=A0A553QGV8_9TELE|nr:hypothetical protein DNTS_018079 [Danionella translucida]
MSASGKSVQMLQLSPELCRALEFAQDQKGNLTSSSPAADEPVEHMLKHRLLNTLWTFTPALAASRARPWFLESEACVSIGQMFEGQKTVMEQEKTRRS